MNRGFALGVLLIVSMVAWAQETAEPGVIEPEVVQQEVIQQESGSPQFLTPQSGDGLPEMPPKELFDGIVQRPLFSVNRRPQAAVVGDSSESALRDTWKLAGVVLVDRQPQALFAEREGDKRLKLSSGMPLDDNWLVESINPLAVVLNNGDQLVTLEVFEPRELPRPMLEQTDEQQSEDDQAPASIESRAQSAVQQLRERVDALKGGSQ